MEREPHKLGRGRLRHNLKRMKKYLSGRFLESLTQKTGFAFAAITLLSLPLLFFHLGGWSFLDPDEGRYGTIPAQMLERADFITPKQNELKFFDKPPLLYWGIAASYRVFGLHEWAARLIPALAALMGLLAVYGLGRRMFGARAGLIGAVILATSLMWPLMARVVVTDMLVSSLVFVALTFWWLGHCESRNHQRRQTGYFLGFWVILALAVLAKGPIAVVLTGGCIFLYLLLCKQWLALKTMRWAMGLPVFLSIVAPWFVMVAQRNPEFNHFFWYDQHIGRFLGQTTGNDHVQGAGYYLQFLPLIIFPWSVFVPAALFAGWRNLRKVGGATPNSKQRAAIYLLCGVVFTTAFFSASSGKLLTYILPVVPLLALLLAAYFDRILAHIEVWNRALWVSVAVLASVLTVVGIAVLVLAPSKLQGLGMEKNAAMWVGTLLLAWAFALAIFSWKFRLKGAIASTAGGFTATFVALLLVAASIIPRFTTEALVEAIRPGLLSDARSEVLTVGYIRSIPFYTGRRVEILGPPDELKMGVASLPLKERKLWVFDGPAKSANLREEMSDPYPVYCFVQSPRRKRWQFEQLLKEVGNGAAPIAANERFVVFGNHAALAVTPPQMGSLE